MSDQHRVSTGFQKTSDLSSQSAQLDDSLNLKVNVVAGGGGGGATTIADGADVAQGATTDAAVVTDVAGTLSGKLRGLIKWAFERMPASLGQKPMSTSLPVTLASDQTALAVSAVSLPLPTLASTSTKQSDGTQKSQIVDGANNVIGATSNALDINIKSGNPTTITATQATGTNLHTVLDSGTLTGITNTVVVSGAAGTAIGVQGAAASGASKVGNPVQIGGVFNTTQPTVTTGQVVEAQSTARGAQIVAPGVDSFAVQAVLGAETTKVIGTVNLSAGQTLGTVSTITNVVHVDDNAGSLTVDNAGLSNIDVALSTRLKPADTLTGVTTVGTITNVVHVDDNAGSLTIDATSLPLPNLASTSTKQSDGTQKTQIVDGSGNVGSMTSNAQDVNLKTSSITLPTKEGRSATPAQSTVSVTNVNTAILASNANRLGATLYNESGAVALVKLGATASASSYSISMAIGGYFEAPFNYTGAIDGITASGTATMRVTELT